MAQTHSAEQFPLGAHGGSVFFPTYAQRTSDKRGQRHAACEDISMQHHSTSSSDAHREALQPQHAATSTQRAGAPPMISPSVIHNGYSRTLHRQTDFGTAGIGRPAANMHSEFMQYRRGAFGRRTLKSRRNAPRRDTHRGRDGSRNAKSSRGKQAGRKQARGPEQCGILYGLRQKKAGKDLELLDCSGLLVKLAKDQHGSRFIQQKIEICSSAVVDAVLVEIVPAMKTVCCDIFGNYVAQKLLTVASNVQRRHLLAALGDFVVEMSISTYGCRVVQKAIEIVAPEEKLTLVNELKNHVEELVYDQNGNHVIQCCMRSVRPTSEISFISKPFLGKIEKLACHPYGCRVVQRFLENFDGSLGQQVLHEIMKSKKDLILDKYGNYVVQHLLTHGPTAAAQAVARVILSNIEMYCKHKYASNVAELVMKGATSEERYEFIETVLGTASLGGVPLLKTMAKDPYANYVVQRMLSISCPDQLSRMKTLLISEAETLGQLSYGKHVLRMLGDDH